MNPFNYERAAAPDTAIRSGAAHGAKFLAGGTNLVDLMKYGVESPTTLVDINHLDLAQVTQSADGGVSIGALVRNSDLADHTLIKNQYPLLSQALLSGASPQLRNMATTGGNLLQRTRCYYFTDVSFPACNKRVPGSGCAAIKGYNRIHAILGQSDKGPTSGESCIATHPSDMCVAMAALDAKVEVEGPRGRRTIPFAEFHKLAGTTPWIETALRPDELIIAVTLPPPRFAKNAYYLKARDRNSYAFALISVAVGLEMEGDHIQSVGIALGGVALKPWRRVDAEKVLLGKPAGVETFTQVANLLLQGAKGYEHNSFKIELAKQGVVRALTLASQGTTEGSTGMMQDMEAPPKAVKQLDHRYEGIAKVTGKAKYAAEFSEPLPKSDLVYAYIVQSTIPSGTIVAIERIAADRAPGVIAILTPFNTPKLNPGPPQPPARRNLSLLQNADVNYNGQPVAVVVARSLNEAKAAAAMLKFKYSPKAAKVDFKENLGEARWPKNPGKEPAGNHRGDLPAAFSKSSIIVESTYITPIQYHNPMEPHATIAWWEGEKLNVYDATQYISGVRMSLAKTLNIPLDYVRVVNPVVGGGFGSKGSMWSHVPLCAIAAKVTGKPVKLVLEREQMFGPVGGRPSTVNKIKLGASADGKLLAMQQDVVMNASVMEDFVEHSEGPTKNLYMSDANSVTAKVVEVNLGVSTFMRAPGEAPGTAVLEIAMDELAEKLKMDPMQLRLVNYADKDPSHDRPWSSKHLRECYAQASERFGWSKRSATPGSKTEGNALIGYGMATATYPANRSAAQAVVRMLPGGRMFVGSGTQDLGTGTYTIMAQQAAAGLGLDPKMVEVKLGDSALPRAPVSGGSQSSASVLPAIQDATAQLKLKLADLAIADTGSPLHGLKTLDIVTKEGKLINKNNPSQTDSLTDLIARNGGNSVEAMGSAEPSESRDSMTSNSWGAVFAEVAVDKDTHMVKVRRVVATYDIGTLLNDKTGLNQLMGGITWGISFALHEEAHIDPVYGRTVNESLAEYHVPVNADIGILDVTVLDIPDFKFNPIGSRGIGEIGITGTAAAIANAIYNATGKRIREYPITLDKIMTDSL